MCLNNSKNALKQFDETVIVQKKKRFEQKTNKKSYPDIKKRKL